MQGQWTEEERIILKDMVSGAWTEQELCDMREQWIEEARISSKYIRWFRQFLTNPSNQMYSWRKLIPNQAGHDQNKLRRHQ